MSNGDQNTQSGTSERTRLALIIGTAIGLVFVILVLSAWVAQFFAEPVRIAFLVIVGIVSLVGVVATLIVVFKTLHSTNQASNGKPVPCDDDVPAIRAAVVVVGTIVIVVSLLAGGAWLMTSGHLDDAVRLPLLVIAGLVSLISLLAVMAIAFKTVDLADKTQALGLPDGTVRAVIALSLILIFAVVTVYLFSDLSDPDRITRPMLDSAGKLVTDSAGHTVTETVTESAKLLMDTTARPVLDSAGKPVVDTAGKAVMDASPKPVLDSAGKPVAEPPSPEDTRRASKLAASQDFAKQLLIMLGTLITSITSFYFASKTATDTRLTTSSAPPTLTGVDRPSLLTADLPANVIGQGTGLQPAQNVVLRNSAQTEVPANGVSSNDTTVHFVVPTGTATGKWDVVVKMIDGSAATLPAAITIT